MRKLNILHITYDMRIGGTEMVIKNLIEASDSERYTMSIFCIEQPVGPWGQQLEKNGIGIFAKHRKQGFDFSMIGAIRTFVKKHNIDIVHCHQYTPWSYGTLACIGLKAKVIFTEHGRFYPDIKSPKRRWINPILESFTEAITAISQATAQALIEYEYITKEKIQVIYNGIADNERTYEPKDVKQLLGIDKDKVIIGTIARLDPIKNHLMMLKSVHQLLEAGANLHFVLVGDGECRKQIEQCIEELGIREHVSLTGYITQPNDYLAIMDIFLLTSFSEGTSMTLLEAMRAKKPCVVTNVGGNPEVILDDYNGIVIESNDVNALTDSLNALLSNPELIIKMGDNGLARFSSEFTASKMCSEYAKIYTNLS